MPLTRIGAPPPGKKKRRVRWTWIVPPAVVALGLIATVVGYVIAGGPDSVREMLGLPKKGSSSAALTETQVECANIKHAYAVWNNGRTDLETLQVFPLDMASFRSKRLVEDGETFLDAVDGHTDQPAKHLAAAVAGYNVELGFLNLGLQLGPTFDNEAHQKAIDAWREVDVAYVDFLSKTCT